MLGCTLLASRGADALKTSIRLLIYERFSIKSPRIKATTNSINNPVPISRAFGSEVETSHMSPYVWEKGLTYNQIINYIRTLITN